MTPIKTQRVAGMEAIITQTQQTQDVELILF